MAKDRTRLLRHFSRDARGATAVEFAMVSVPLFMLLFGIFEMAVLFFYGQAVQSVAETAARLIMTGTAQQAGYSQTTFIQTICKNNTSVSAIFNCNNLYVDVQSAQTFTTLSTTPIVLTYDSTGKVNNVFNYSPGVQTNAVIVRVIYNYPVWWTKLLPQFVTSQGNAFQLTGTAVVRNEPYP